MLHIRIVSPPDTTARVVDYLAKSDSVINLVAFAGAARKPTGDLVTCDVAREDGSIVLAALTEFGCEARGTISVDPIEISLSSAARRAEKQAAGFASDAVIWEEVTAQTSDSAELSVGFALFMVLATLIAAIGILTDSVVLIIGAMVVGPEFGPLAGFCVAVVQRRGALAARSLVALVVGFPLGIVAAYLGTLLLVAVGLAPPTFTAAHPHTMFIVRPDAYAAIIAFLAGVAGMFSLTTAKAGALIGVFISITTIPAAANIGVAAAYRNWGEVHGALLQLATNVSMLIISGLFTLTLQRLAFARRHRAQRARGSSL
jgi:uncharacterized hydrophobic protein (TIGR00271 family)